MKRCIERKRFLSGAEVTFECELVALEEGFGILRYVLDRQWHVHGLTLKPGVVTYAFYWTDRPYNLYWWVDEKGATVGHYFNLADSVVLSEQEFVWRDLIVDILVTPAGEVHVIDADEVPRGLDNGLKEYIFAAKRQVLDRHPTIICEAVQALKGFKRAY